MDKKYVLITPARDEEQYIEKTIRSVISQTVLPQKWVIVSDGSTDRTDEIVNRYKSQCPFIELLRRAPDGGRNFASKIFAFRAGVERLDGNEYDFIANLDADVCLGPDYYERVLENFRDNSRLGVLGGILFEPCNGRWVRQLVSDSWSVSGPIMVFRRQCYEDIGGYLPVAVGGEDTIAEVTARMHGWQVKTFPDIEAKHLRRTGTATRNILRARFNEGVMEYCVGYRLLYECAKFLYRLREKPFVLGAGSRLTGYIWSLLLRKQRSVPEDVLKYLRREQIKRLCHFCRK